MFFRKKELEEKNAKQAQTINKVCDLISSQQRIIKNQNNLIGDYRATWKSPDGQIILNDLQRALNLIVAYQGSLNTLCAPDPHVVDARLLLSKYGQKGLTSGRGVKGLEEFIQTREDEEASGKLKS